MYYVICFVNRSGSNYLCDLLKSAGIGIPAEYYYPLDFRKRVRCQFPANKKFDPQASGPAEYWHRVCESQGEIVGVKANFDAFQVFRSEVDLRLPDLHYIYLTRKDKLRQAISWYRADHTETWSSFAPSAREDPPFDRAQIDKYLRYIRENEQNWEQFLADKKYLPLIYEELGPQTVFEIAAHVGVSVTDAPRSGFSIQRDATTEEFVRLYLSRRVRGSASG